MLSWRLENAKNTYLTIANFNIGEKIYQSFLFNKNTLIIVLRDRIEMREVDFSRSTCHPFIERTKITTIPLPDNLF
jgi:hypothetical protein